MARCNATRDALLLELGLFEICPICNVAVVFHDTDMMKLEMMKLSIEAEAEVRKEEIKAEAKVKKAEAEVKKEEIKAEVRKEEIRRGFVQSSVPIFDWVTLQKEQVAYSLSMTFDQFKHNVKVAFAGTDIHPTFRLYSLPQGAMIDDRKRVDSATFHEHLQPFVNSAHGGTLPTLYVFNSDESLTKLPETAVTEVKSRSSRNSTSQDTVRSYIISRDGECVFCGSSDCILDAAHILDHHRATPDLIKSLGLAGVDDYRNVISLCKMCHSFFDGQMLCINPDDSTVIVCDAFLACSPHREKYRSLNGLKVRVQESTIAKQHWPADAVLRDRFKVFLATSELRRERNEKYPYYCIGCNQRWKTIRPMTSHTCKLDHVGKASAHAGKHYQTPEKGSVESSHLFSNEAEVESAYTAIESPHTEEPAHCEEHESYDW
jgi:hypothetical protein